MSPRFHPFVRLVLCVVAVLAAKEIIGVALSGGIAGTSAALLFCFALMPVSLFVVALCRRWMDGQTLASLGLRARGAVPDFARGTLCGALAIAFIFGVLWLCGGLEVRGLSDRAQQLDGAGIAARLAVWALAMLCVGVVEEVLFRGYALHNLGVWLGVDKLGLSAAAILQGVVFALMHLNNFGLHPAPEQAASAWQAMPNIALIGVFFALCYYKTGALWFPIGFHAAWNFFLGSVFSLPVSGLQFFKLLDVRVAASHWVSGGPFGVEGSLLLTALTATMIYLVRRADDHPQALADIRALVPADEMDEVEVASRAPRLRERKEQRTAQIPQKTTFEGWNDLKPEQREPYSVYKPAVLAPNASPDATVTVPEAVAVSAEAPGENFSDFRPAVEAAPSAPADLPSLLAASQSAPETVPDAPLPDAPETKTLVAAPPIPAPLSVSSPPVTPPLSDAPPVKKPPSPRW